MRLFSRFLNQNCIIRNLKNKRNALINYYFLKQKSSDTELLLTELRNEKSVVFSIAFNKPKCIEFLIYCWRQNAKNTELIIIDNSTDPISRIKIKNLCQNKNILYLALPKNPEWHPNRSHALAMNWVFYNIVIKISPKYFGYLDHDCFPFYTFDLNDKLESSLIYGEKRVSEKLTDVWSFWAGFCFFNFEYVKIRKLNFTHSLELGLDTGGQNWDVLYKGVTTNKMYFARSYVLALMNLNSNLSQYNIVDEFVHFGSASRQDKGNQFSVKNGHHIIEQLQRKLPNN